MKLTVSTIIICLISIGNTIAQNSEPVSLSSSASDQVTIPDSIIKAVDSVFAEYDNTRTPGCAVGVVKNGNLIFARGYGMANLEHNVPIGPESVFRIGSTSKQVTAGAIALLAQQGVLSLDDAVRKWIPELPEHAYVITLKHLLHHTSGIRDYFLLKIIGGTRQMDWYSDDEVLDLLTRQEALNFQPGSEHLYSNSGYFLLSEVVERATGETLAEYAEKNLFIPIAMEHSHFHNDPMRIVQNRATGYSPIGDGSYRINVTTLPMIGDGGVFSTIEDMALWAQNLAEPKVGGKEWQETMFTPGVLSSGDTTDYALGLYYGEHRGLKTVGHGGAFVGYRADLTRFPDYDHTIITLCNRSDAAPSRRSLQVAEAFLEEHMTPEEATVSADFGEKGDVALEPALLDQFADTYWQEKDVGALIYLSQDAGRLMVNNIAGSETNPLIQLSDSVFRLEDESARLVFASNPDEKTQQVKWEWFDGRSWSLQRIEPWGPNLRELKEFEGQYYSPEVDTSYEIVLEDNQLVARHHQRDDLPLTPAEQDGFGSVLPFIDVQFQRDEKDQITGFLVSAGRVQDIRFEKQE